MHKQLLALSAYIALILGTCAFAATTAAAQDFLGKTVVYNWHGAPSQVYIAPSGNVYWSIQTVSNGKVVGVRQGTEAKLGRTIRTSMKGCKVTTRASSSGNTLILDVQSVCPTIQATAQNVITFSGDSCEMNGSGTSLFEGEASSYDDAALSCEVRHGNRLAQ